MALRYLGVVRALTATVALAACGHRSDPSGSPPPLVSPGAALLDASMTAGTLATAPAMPTATPPPVAPPADAATTDPEIAFKEGSMALGCPATVPSGPCGTSVSSDCLYDPATTGLASAGTMACRCLSGTWSCGRHYRFRGRIMHGPLEPPESIA